MTPLVAASVDYFSTLYMKDLTLSWRRPLSYRNQSTDLLCKSMDWFLYHNGLRHERVNIKKTSRAEARRVLVIVKLLRAIKNLSGWFIHITCLRLSIKKQSTLSFMEDFEHAISNRVRLDKYLFHVSNIEQRVRIFQIFTFTQAFIGKLTSVLTHFMTLVSFYTHRIFWCSLGI